MTYALWIMQHGVPAKLCTSDDRDRLRTRMALHRVAVLALDTGSVLSVTAAVGVRERALFVEAVERDARERGVLARVEVPVPTDAPGPWRREGVAPTRATETADDVSDDSDDADETAVDLPPRDLPGPSTCPVCDAPTAPVHERTPEAFRDLCARCRHRAGNRVWYGAAPEDAVRAMIATRDQPTVPCAAAGCRRHVAPYLHKLQVALRPFCAVHRTRARVAAVYRGHALDTVIETLRRVGTATPRRAA